MPKAQEDPKEMGHMTKSHRHQGTLSPKYSKTGILRLNKKEVPEPNKTEATPGLLPEGISFIANNSV